MPATDFATTVVDGPETNTASACRPANARPRGDAPAWKIAGVRWAEGSQRNGPGTSNQVPWWPMSWTFAGSV